MKSSVLIIGLFFFQLFGCEKAMDMHQNESQNMAGLVLFFGEPAVDGCGWLIQVDTAYYSPINLEPEFKVDSLNVNLDFELQPDRWRCGWRQPGYQKIQILKIEKE